MVVFFQHPYRQIWLQMKFQRYYPNIINISKMIIYFCGNNQQLHMNCNWCDVGLQMHEFISEKKEDCARIMKHNVVLFVCLLEVYNDYNTINLNILLT